MSTYRKRLLLDAEFSIIDFCKTGTKEEKNMNKSAREMFEEFGLNYSNNGYQKCYYNDFEDKYIWFFTETQTIEINFDINVNYLQAINQQCKELGWFNE